MRQSCGIWTHTSYVIYCHRFGGAKKILTNQMRGHILFLWIFGMNKISVDYLKCSCKLSSRPTRIFFFFYQLNTTNNFYFFAVWSIIGVQLWWWHLSWGWDLQRIIGWLKQSTMWSRISGASVAYTSGLVFAWNSTSWCSASTSGQGRRRKFNTLYFVLMYFCYIIIFLLLYIRSQVSNPK